MLKKISLHCGVVAVADETTSEQISITIKSVFAVDAKILGI